MIVNVFDLTAPAGYASPWADTGGRFYDEAARVAAFHGLWDSTSGRFKGGEAIDRSEFARSVVIAATGDDRLSPKPVHRGPGRFAPTQVPIAVLHRVRL